MAWASGSGWAIMAMAAALAGDGPLEYPKAKTGDVVEQMHGVKVADPYRWLEDDVRKNPEVAAWVEAQNKVTNAYLDSIPERGRIAARLKQLWNFERFSAPRRRGGKYFFSKNDGLQNQAVLYVQEGPDGAPETLVDPNAWAKDGTVALSGTSISDDGKLLAYAIADAGSDWNTWRILDVATKKPLADEIRWVKFSSADWTPDGKGFFYARFDEPAANQKFQSLNLNQKLYYHRVGTPQSADELVYARPDFPKWGFSTNVTEDGKYLLISVRTGTDARERLFFKDLGLEGAKVEDLIPNFDQMYNLIGNDGSVLYFHTDHAAPRGRVIAIDLAKPGPANWREIVPQSADTLTSVGLLGDTLLCDCLQDAKSRVKRFGLDGTPRGDVELPGIGSAGGFDGKRSDTETFYTFTSFAAPPTVYRYDVAANKSTAFRTPKVPFDAAAFEVKQVFYASKDGTKVPMFIAHRKGLKLDGTNPTLLYGYGGFNISLTPSFSVARIAWMEMGGVLAVANLRGGGEYGQEWHKAGTKQKKQNVFDDFIAAAEWLIKENYTAAAKLAIQGGSNGGLLVGACMTQRPELFGACLPAVGVMDMLRFQQFTAGRYWVDDYGSSENAADFPALRAYSPYHNLKPGTKYPPTLVTTADTDDRVVPGHSFKFTAALQAAQAGPAPTLARIETRAGHGAGKPTAKLIQLAADEWGFLVKSLGMTVPADFGK